MPSPTTILLAALCAAYIAFLVRGVATLTPVT
jgi:hypothetical protein